MELSSKRVGDVFPEFHPFASFMAYTLHPSTFYQSGVQTRTQSLFMILGERERRLDSIEARGVTWEGAKEK